MEAMPARGEHGPYSVGWGVLTATLAVTPSPICLSLLVMSSHSGIHFRSPMQKIPNFRARKLTAKQLQLA